MTSPLLSPQKDVQRKEHGNSILMTRHFWLAEANFPRGTTNPRSTSQIRVQLVTRHQYGISALVCQKSFGGKTSGGVVNVGGFLRLLFTDVSPQVGLVCVMNTYYILFLQLVSLEISFLVLLNLWICLCESVFYPSQTINPDSTSFVYVVGVS